MDAHRGHEPVSMIVPADGKNLFLQVSVPQLDDKTLIQVNQSFAYRSVRIGSWKVGGSCQAPSAGGNVGLVKGWQKA